MILPEKVGERSRAVFSGENLVAAAHGPTLAGGARLGRAKINALPNFHRPAPASHLHRNTFTGMPVVAWRKKTSAAPRGKRMQPWEAGYPGR